MNAAWLVMVEMTLVAVYLTAFTPSSERTQLSTPAGVFCTGELYRAYSITPRRAICPSQLAEGLGRRSRVVRSTPTRPKVGR
jgi:hypothetical protein